MSASKIKNLILLILLLGVLGLLPAVVPTQAARTGAERNVHEKLEELYSSYGLTLDASSLPDSQTLYATRTRPMPRRRCSAARRYRRRRRRVGLQATPLSSARCSSAAPGS